MEENGGAHVTEVNGKAGNGGSSRGDTSLEVNGDRKRSRENAENDSISLDDKAIEEKRRRVEDASSIGANNGGSTKSVTDKDEKKIERTTQSQGLLDEDPQTDEDHDVPIKEIHMTRKEKEEEERWRKLDQPTMDRLREALSNAKPRNHLNDDEVLNFIHRVDREARAHSNLQAGSLADESDGSLHEELLAEAEDLNLGREVFSRALHVLHPNDSSDSNDRRTIDWVRKAAGLHRAKTENLEAGRYATGTGKGKRYTRRMAHKTREERREKGLGILLSALDELEPSIGPYPQFKPKRRRRSIPEVPDAAEAPKTPKTNNRKKQGENRRKTLTKPLPKQPPSDHDEAVRNNGYKADRAPRRGGAGNKSVVAWDDVWPAEDEGPQPYQFPTWKIDSAAYARKVKRVLNSMSRSVLTWSRYEFFYGDVDRAWYGDNICFFH